MMKKIIALLLSALMLLPLASCASEQPEEEKTKKPHPVAKVEDEPETPEGDGIDDSTANYWVDLVVDNDAQYTIVSESQEYDAVATRLKDGLYQNTGVTFPTKLSDDNKRVTGKKISIGKNPELYLTNPSDLTYLGNLSVDRGETIYLAGYCVEAVSATVDRFLSGVLLKYKQVDENGNIQVQAPDIRLFFLYNPTTYATTSAKLLGVDLSEFVIVLPEHMNTAEKLMAQYLISEIGTNTGVVIKQTTDKTAPAAHEIVLGETTRFESQFALLDLPADSYKIKGVDGSLYVLYDNYLVMSDARDQINSIYMNSTSAEDPEIYCVEKPNYSSQMLHRKNDSDIRVMTSNIVAAGDDGARKDYDINGITYKDRIGIQAVAILDYLPDFIGFQEIQEGTTNGVPANMRTELANALSEEYSYVEYSNVPSQEYWNPIFYRHTVWNLEAKEASEPFDNGMHRWQWALFSRIDNEGEQYILMNTHYPISKEAAKQLAAANAVNAQLDALKEAYPGVPIFLTGDFNARVGTNTFETTISDTGLVTANRDSSAIDHVIYDQALLTREQGMFIKNGWIAKTSDHRPFFADFSRN